MLKMLSTQLTGLFLKVIEKEEFNLEDGARLLAQAAVGEGNIIIKGFHEMAGIEIEALNGVETIEKIQQFKDTSSLTHIDRVLIFTRFSDDREAVQLAKELNEKNIPFVAVSGVKEENSLGVAQLADIHINTHLLRPLLPTETGERVGFPSPMIAFFIYYALKFTLDEMLEEL